MIHDGEEDIHSGNGNLGLEALFSDCNAEYLCCFTLKNQITPQDYLETKGQDYRNMPFLQIYGYAGAFLSRLRRALVRIVIGGRSRVYGVICQGES